MILWLDFLLEYEVVRNLDYTHNQLVDFRILEKLINNLGISYVSVVSPLLLKKIRLLANIRKEAFGKLFLNRKSILQFFKKKVVCLKAALLTKRETEPFPPDQLKCQSFLKMDKQERDLKPQKNKQ